MFYDKNKTLYNIDYSMIELLAILKAKIELNRIVDM